MKLTVATAILAALTMGHAGIASAGPGAVDWRGSANIKNALESLLKQGATSADSPLSSLAADSAYLGNASTNIPYVAMVPTVGGLSVKTRLPITGQPERPQRDVREILAKVNDACTSAGGSSARRDIPGRLRSSGTPVVARGFKALISEELIGQFWCTTPDEKPLFMVEVLPAPGASVPLIPIGWDWNIAFRIVSSGALEQYQAKRVDYEKSVAELRSGIKVGAQVQVRTSDLPDSLTEDWRNRRHDQVGNFCGLVTEVNLPLVQVQIQSTQIAIEIDKLLPQGIKKGLVEVTSFDLAQPHAWCVR
jgi:hypothetical protein